MESGDDRQSRFEDLVLTHWGDLHRLALGIGYDNDSAARLIEITLLAGADNLDDFNTPLEAKLWLLKLMMRYPEEALCNEVRDLTADRTVFHFRSKPNPVPPEEPDPLQVGVHQGLQQLPGEQRLIVLLAILDSRSCDEIAGILKISPSTVRSELALGLIQFHSCMNNGSLEAKSAFKESFHFGR